jgi:uncharacterized protein YcbK (DUF882 family)/LysM repeat protein
MLSDRRIGRCRGLGAALALVLAGVALAPQAATAEQKHVVRPGQSLGFIARQYGTTVATLAAVNGINPDGILPEGKVLRLPGAGGTHVVAAGQSLSIIARDYHVGVSALASANGLTRESTLQIGQRLLLPDGAVKAKAAEAKVAAPAAQPSSKPQVAKADAPAKPVAAKSESATKIELTSTPAAKIAAKAAASGKTPPKNPWGKPKQPGVVELFRIWSKESLRVRLVDARGRLRQDARRELREFLRPRDSQRRKSPNARLLTLLARVSDHFGGRPLHIVSGYRIAKGLTRKTSRHVAGEAIDFRIPGVPLTVLRDYCQQFSDVGVGYYPTTEFVHLDVRKQPARWTDWSLPGQPPVLSKPVEYDENGKEDVITTPDADETAERQGDEAVRRTDSPAG